MAPARDTAVIFDLDNTLVHSSINFPMMRRRVIEVINAHGLDLSSVGPLDSLATAEVIALALERGDGMPDGLEQDIWAVVTEEETRGMERATVEGDAAIALRELRTTGVTLALLTNNARSAALTALERFELLEHLDLVLGRDDVPALKPSPAGLLHARERLNLARRFAMVGDATIDGLASNRAAMPFIAFRPREDEMDRRGVERWATIQTLSELPSVIARISGQ